MPRRNRNVVKTRDSHRMSLMGADGLPVRIPGRRVNIKARRKAVSA
jgi:hypothetical protein